MNDQTKNITETVVATARQFSMFASGSKVLAAVSGGADSMCMLDILCALRAELGISVAVAHLNHSTRGAESDADEQFVKEAVKKYGLDFHCGKIGGNVKMPPDHGSLEDRLRRARRDFLVRTAAECGADLIALAHNRDDQAETVLMRILRGTSPDGLAAMQAVSRMIVRPLLQVCRKDIEAYCREKSIAFRTDSSNIDERFLRNKIRHSLIPTLEKDFNPNLREQLVALSDMVSEDFAFLEDAAKKAGEYSIESRGEKTISFRLHLLRSLHPSLLKRVLRNSAFELLGKFSWMLDRSHIESMAALVHDGQAGRSASLPRNMAATLKYETLEIGPIAQETDHRPFAPITFTLNTFPCEIEIPAIGKKMVFDIQPFNDEMLKNTDMNTAYFDTTLKDKELTIRARKDGDIFHALGAPGPKKLKDFLIDEKIDRDKRDLIPLLIRDSEIAWVPGIRSSHTFRLSPSPSNGDSVVVVKLM